MFRLFGRKKDSEKVQPPEGTPPTAPGWEAVEKAFCDLYAGQRPRWWERDGVPRMYDLKNPPENPLEAVAIFDAGSFWHYVSFGMSDLFAKESDSGWSGFGYEFTFRLAKWPGADAPLWPVNILVALAKAAHNDEEFAPNHTIKTGPIDGQPETRATALLMVHDPGVKLIDTPHGKVAFLLLLGVEGAIRERALNIGVDAVVTELAEGNPDLITRV